MKDRASPWAEPDSAVELPVDKGLYAVLLGDTNLDNMDVPIHPAIFTNPAVNLRVWFSGDGNGFQHLTPDQRLVPVGYAMMAGGVHSEQDIVAPRLNIGTDHTLTDDGATIGGGSENEAGGWRATIGGGHNNTAGSSYATIAGGLSATVGGGYTNQATGSRSTVGGGMENAATQTSSTVGGGFRNTASGMRSTVSGGHGNTAGGSHATVPGGGDNRAQGGYSFAAGRNASANHNGSFVWGDSYNEDVASSGNNQVTFRASGGFRIFSNTDLSQGVRVAANGSSWLSISDRNAKENFEDIDAVDIVERLTAIPVQTWTYKADPDQRHHIGPVAQDFHAAFGLGDDTTISTLDADGVLFAAVQGLHELTGNNNAEISALRSENAALRAENQRMASELQAIRDHLGM